MAVKGPAPPGVRLGIVSLELDGLLTFLDCLDVILLAEKSEAPPEVGIGVVCLELDGLLEFFNRFGVASLPEKIPSQLDVGTGVVRLADGHIKSKSVTSEVSSMGVVYTTRS